MMGGSPPPPSPALSVWSGGRAAYPGAALRSRLAPYPILPDPRYCHSVCSPMSGTVIAYAPRCPRMVPMSGYALMRDVRYCHSVWSSQPPTLSSPIPGTVMAHGARAYGDCYLATLSYTMPGTAIAYDARCPVLP
eukprot:3093118-Rhodomonas_salina.1